MAAKKKEEEQVSMIDTFKDFKETKNIDRTTLVSVLEESFRNVLAKIFGSDENFDVIVNPDKGDFEDRKSTRLNSSHANISYAVFCLKKKTMLRQRSSDDKPAYT